MNLAEAKRRIFGGYELNKQIMERVWLERLRQKDLLRAGKIKFDCASPIVCSDRKLRVLVEEIGEVAHAVDGIEATQPIPLSLRQKELPKFIKAQAHLREELTQVAAVAIAWLEALEETK